MNKENNDIHKHTNNNIPKYGLSIESFICDEFSICREERQYAVFLYNILCKYSDAGKRKKQPQNIKNIFTACHIPENSSIDHVFYEAAFMRDFFERNRRLTLSKNYSKEDLARILLQAKFSPGKCEVTAEESFNTKLIQYVYGKEHKEYENVIKYSGKEQNLGHNTIEFEKLLINGKKLPDNEKDWLQYRIKWMMNAKPDIAVIYHTAEDKLKFLLFIECKFDSGESSYSYKDKNGNTERMIQREVQYNIAEFLCSHYLNSNHKEKIINPSPDMVKNRKACLTRFVRENTDAANSKIAIEELIKLNDKIFQPL